MSTADNLAYRHRGHTTKYDYPFGLIVIGLCTAIAVFLRTRVAITNLAMLYLLSVIAVSIACRQGAAVLSALLAVTSFYYYCVPPWNSFVIEDYSYVIILVTTLTVALVITTLTIKIRAQADHALEREERTRSIYQLNHDLSAEATVLAAARTAARSIASIFGATVDVYLTDEQRVVTYHEGLVHDGTVPEGEKNLVQSILRSGARNSNLFRSGEQLAVRHAMPLVCGGTIVAVLALVPDDRDRLTDPEQLHFLEALCNQIGAAIERLRHIDAVREAETEIQAERTRNALLNAVSHDIKTPLASIYGAATSLLEEENRLSPADRHELVESIADEAERLNRVVNNLLEMTRLDAGLQATKDWRPLEEIIGAALAWLEKPLRDRSITTHIADDLPWICVDDVLIEQVLINILENAVKYTPTGTAIEIAARRNGDKVVVLVRDKGTGFAPGEEDHVFEKFFRGKTGVRGVGLGLAICRAIVHGHDGTIYAANSPEGGAMIRFELPIGGVPPHMGVIPESTYP